MTAQPFGVWFFLVVAGDGTDEAKNTPTTSGASTKAKRTGLIMRGTLFLIE
jgi:hypothetical protein